MPISTQEIFNQLLKLQGKEVEVGLKPTADQPSVIRGEITNTMFDSFLVQTSESPVVIRFEDLNYLLPKE